MGESANRQKESHLTETKTKPVRTWTKTETHQHNITTTTTNTVDNFGDVGAHPRLEKVHLSHSRVVPLPGIRTSSRDYQPRPKESRLALQTLYRVHTICVCREGAITENSTREKYRAREKGSGVRGWGRRWGRGHKRDIPLLASQSRSGDKLLGIRAGDIFAVT